MGAPLRIEVTDTLGDDRADWDALVAAQPQPSAFLRSWWVEHAGAGTTALLRCRDGDALVGGFAVEVDRIGRGPASVERVRCVGQGDLAPDHLDVFAAAGRHDDVLDAVLAWLRRPGSRLVDLDGLAADGRLANALRAHEIDRIAAPYATLPSTVDEYVAARPGRVRSTISRTRKRLVRSGATIERVVADDHARALDALADLHDGRWGETSGFLGSWGRFRTAAGVGLERGDVRATEVRDADGTVVATEWDLVTGDRVAFYQAGRSTDHEWRGAGSVLRADIIEAAIADGAHEYDLLRGDEPYKAEWSDGRRMLVRVRFGVGGVGRTVSAGAAMWRRIEPSVRAASSRLRSGVGTADDGITDDGPADDGPAGDGTPSR